MQKATLHRFSLAILSLAVVACGPLKVKAPQTYRPNPDIERIGLMATYVMPPRLPERPVADASTFNKKVEKLAPELKELLQKKADEYYKTVAQGLGTSLEREIVYDEKFKEADRYDLAMRSEEKEPLKIKGGGKFREIYVGEGGVNVLPFKEGKVAEFLQESPRLRSIARKTARNFGADITAFSVHELVLDRVSSFGESAKAHLLCNIYIFDDRGTIAGHARGETDAMEISGDQLEEFKVVLNQYDQLQQSMLQALTKIPEEEKPEEEDAEEE